MKPQHTLLRFILFLSLTFLLLPAQVTQTWGNGSGTWDTTTANWSGAVWTNGNNATIGTTGARTGTITVDGGGVSVSNVVSGSGGGAVYSHTLQGGSIALAGGSSTWTIGGPAGSQLLVSSAITGGGSLEKLGTRLLILAGNNTYAGTTTITAGALQIGNGGTTGAVAGNIVANSSLTFNRSDTYTYGGVISGTSAVTHAGSGTLVLTGDSTDTNSLTVSGGTLQLGAGGGGSWAGGIVNNGAVVFNRGSALNYDRAISGSGTVTIGGSGAINLNAASTYVGATTVNSGATLGGSGSLTSAVTVAGGGTLAGTAGQTLTMGGLTLNGTSNLNVALGAASTTGLFAINGNLTLDGTLNITNAGGFGPGLYRLFDYTGALTDNGLVFGLTGGASASDLAIQTSTANQVNLFFDAGPANIWRGGTGTWNVGGTGWTDILGVIDNPWQPNFAIFNSGAGTVTIDTGGGAVEATGVQFAADGFTVAGGTLTNNTANAVFRVGNGTGGGASMGATLSAPITGTGGLNKTDLGTLTLSGANTYAGATTVTAGTLRINGDQSGATGAVTVANGGTLTGSGTLGGAVTVANGGTLAGTTGQTLTMPGLVLNSSSNINAALGAPGAAGLFQVNGNLTLDGTLNVTSAGSFAPGVHRLIDYTGALTNNTLGLGSAPVGLQFLAVQTSVANQVNLVFDAGPRNFWRGGAGTWTADAGSTAWSEFTYNAATFWTPQFAIFQATPAGTVTIDTTAGAVEATGAQFAIDGYTLAGGALTNNTANAVFRVGDGSSGGAAMNATISAAITGTGGLDKTDLGTLTLSGANTYAGATTVSGGTLRINGNQSGATGAVTVASGGTLAGSGTLGGVVTVANGGTLAGAAGSTLTLPGLTLNGTSNLNLSLGAPSTTGLFQINGNLTLDGTLNITNAGGFAPGLYRLFNYTGSLTDNGLAIGTPGGAPPANLAVQTSVANQVNLVFDLGAQNFWRGGAGTWTASAGSTAWTDFLGSTSVAWTPQLALFQATPSGTVTVDTGAGAVALTGAQFAVDGYTLAGGALTNNTANAIFRVGDGSSGGAAMNAAISAAITGTGGLDKTDLGTLTLSGANTYAGATTVSGGTLRINGNQSGATGAVTVASGGTLAGSGTLGGVVTVANGGTLAGAAGSTLTLPGLTLNGTSNLNLSLGAPSTTGLFQINGNLTLDGTLNITNAGGFAPGLYRLFNYTGSLTDNGLVFGSVAGATLANLSVQTSVASQVNLILLDTTTLLPIWQGGSGTWTANVTGSGFSNASGSIAGGWRPGLAIFSGTPGTVTIDTSNGPVIVTGVQFASNGYVLGGGELTTNGRSPFQVGDNSTAGAAFTATINSNIIGIGGIEKIDLGRLVLTGANTHPGGTTVTGGILEVSRDANLGLATGPLTMNGGTLRASAAFTATRPVILTTGNGTFDTAADLTLQGVISGAGGFTKTGAGRLILGGTNTYTGATTITGGSVFLNSSSLAATTVTAGGALTGNGTIRGNLTNQGLLSPGASPGTIMVNGNFAQTAPGNYLVELASATSFDKLAVSGTASLGGTLTVNSLGGYVPAPGQSFTILTATGGVSGTFATVSTPWSQLSAMLRFLPAYGPNDVTLTMTQRPFAGLAGTPNQISIGGAVDGAIASASLTGLRTALNVLPTDATVLAALDQLSPQRYERWFEQSVLSTGATVGSATNRLQEMTGRPHGGLWFELGRRETRFDAEPASPEASGEASGMVVGVDAVVTPAFQVGLLFGYTDEKLDLDPAGSTTARDRFNIALYSRYDALPVRFEAVAGFGQSNLTSRRAIAVPGYVRTAGGETAGFEGFVNLRAAYPLQRGGLDLAPYAAVQYVNAKTNGFTETGADEANLKLDAMTGRSLSTRAGVTLARTFNHRRGILVPRLDVAWRHEMEDGGREITGQLGGSAFMVSTRRPDRSGLAAALGVDAGFGDRLSGYARLDGEWAGTTSAFGARAGLAYRF